MKELKAAVKAPKKKKVETWSQSTKIGDVTKRLEVEKLANGGFLVVFNKYGTDDKGKYVDKTVKTYSENNPLDVEEADALSSVFDNLSRSK